MENKLSQFEPAKKVDKPWGHEIWFAWNDLYVGKILHINQGETLSLQYHNEKDESIYVLSGQLELTLEDDNDVMHIWELNPGQSARILPLKKHRMYGLTEVELCEVSTPQVEDVVRLSDKYGRA